MSNAQRQKKKEKERYRYTKKGDTKTEGAERNKCQALGAVQKQRKFW